MKHLLIVSFSVFSFCTISATNDSIPKEKGRSSTGRVKQIPGTSSTRDALPHSERPFSTLPIERRKAPQPNPQLQQVPRTGNVTTEGRTAEDNLADPWIYTPTRRHLNRWYRNISGFRMFLDQGVTMGFGMNYNHRVDWYGSFGYQFNPIYYVGLGQGFSMSFNDRESSAPVFINPRINFLDENTTPFFDLKVGYSFVEGKGIYINPNFGVSFGKKRRAWNISAGYTFQNADIKKLDGEYNYKYHGASLRLTFEFGVF